MTETKTDEQATLDALELERKLARRLTLYVPLAAIGVALAAYPLRGLGFALMLLAAGALLFAIFQLWWSLRTLAGDAPLEGRFLVDTLAGEAAALEEEKRALLRSLKDLEHEHSIGRITDEDFHELTQATREEAKKIMKRLDDALEADQGALARADRLMKTAEKKGADGEKSAKGRKAKAASASDEEASTKSESVLVDDDSPAGAPGAPQDGDATSADSPRAKRRVCQACDTENDRDASFCKKCGKDLGADA